PMMRRAIASACAPGAERSCRDRRRRWGVAGRLRSVETERAVRALYVEAAAFLPSLQEPRDGVNVVRPHAKCPTLGAHLFDGGWHPAIRPVHHVCFEFIFFIPLQTRRVASRHRRNVLENPIHPVRQRSLPICWLLDRLRL